MKRNLGLKLLGLWLILTSLTSFVAVPIHGWGTLMALLGLATGLLILLGR